MQRKINHGSTENTESDEGRILKSAISKLKNAVPASRGNNLHSVFYLFFSVLSVSPWLIP